MFERNKKISTQKQTPFFFLSLQNFQLTLTGKLAKGIEHHHELSEGRERERRREGAKKNKKEERKKIHNKHTPHTSATPQRREEQKKEWRKGFQEFGTPIARALRGPSTRRGKQSSNDITKKNNHNLNTFKF